MVILILGMSLNWIVLDVLVHMQLGNLDFKIVNERQIVLQLAMHYAYKKRDECQRDFDNLEKN